MLHLEIIRLLLAIALIQPLLQLVASLPLD